MLEWRYSSTCRVGNINIGMFGVLDYIEEEVKDDLLCVLIHKTFTFFWVLIFTM